MADRCARGIPFTRGRSVAVLALTLLLLSVAAFAQQYPAHVGKVNDFASVLSTAQRDQLEADVAGLERDTSAEVAVVTVPSLSAIGIEECATGNAWGISSRIAR